MRKQQDEEPDYLGLRLLRAMRNRECAALGMENEDAAERDPTSICVHGKRLRRSTWRAVVRLTAVKNT